MTTCTLYLVRHGQTDWNVSRTIQGQLDIPLNANGEEQAKNLAKKIKHIHFDAVFSSDLIRAKRTAEILVLEKNLAVVATQALRERSFGLYEGKRVDEAFHALRPLLEQYKSHPHFDKNKVESNDIFMSRVITFIREVCIGYPGKTVLLVSHGDLIITLLIHLGYLKTGKQVTKIDNLAYVKMECDGVEFKVLKTEGIILSTM